MEVKYDDKDLALLLLCSLPTSFANFRETILLSRDELTLAEVYEALQTREKMKGMVQSDVSSSKGEVLDWFSYYKSVQSGDVVRMGDNNPREIVGISSVQIKMHDGMIRTLKDARHIPGMARNLISLSTLDAEGYRHSGLGGVCKHMCLGHMSELGMAELIKRDLLDGYTVGKMKFCEHCVFGKHKRVKFNASVHTTKSTLDYVHADLWGPSRKPSYGGARYMLTIIDDYS
ncbi:unnamed protein product [Miscanthus lutarioriparius]|uniref:GAG-pre-integrase domain-containing protein n=1 Tax=Miscanthus lutarioriparius TaxID=422564 RepID=A0A811R447_9POAL|nr:unnamed protein product [Miscanthus lutarioriparius]